MNARLTVADARQLGRRALVGLGYGAEDAEVIAEHLVLNAMSGYPFAGLPRILAIEQAPERQRPTAPLKVLHETELSLRIDGGNQVAYVALTRATDLALRKLQQSRVCILAMGNSWYAGRSFNYVEKLARAGHVALLFTSGPALVAPHGAARPLLGTNPICVAFPGAVDPVIVDVGTSATMFGEVFLHSVVGKELPANVGIDPEGRPSQDAAQVLKGAILPLAGHKGYSLSFAVQALGLFGATVLPQASQDGVGYLLVAFHPSLLGSPDEFEAAMTRLRQRIIDLPRAPGFDSVEIPSQRTYRNRREAHDLGIEIDAEILRKLSGLAERRPPC